jgi:glyoxylase-like metal-dependent hydrolase (beta-lactamase superfamily II)
VSYATRADNVYLVDTQMFGFEQFHSAYIVAGDEVALIDTGAPLSWDVIRGRIQACGFAPEDIVHVIVTHAEHPDHSGCVGALLAENHRAVAYVHPIGKAYLTDPAVEAAAREKNLAPHMAARFGQMTPIEAARVKPLADGEALDLGRGARLRTVYAPGHQPSGLVVFEERYGSLFINDLCGAYFADADASWIFTPYRSDVRQAMASLHMVAALPARRLFLGHYGISEKPAEVLDRALVNMQSLLDVGSRCLSQGAPDDIEERVLAMLVPEVEKIAQARDDRDLEAYLKSELMPSLAKAFANYCHQTA